MGPWHTSKAGSVSSTAKLTCTRLASLLCSGLPGLEATCSTRPRDARKVMIPYQRREHMGCDQRHGMHRVCSSQAFASVDCSQRMCVQSTQATTWLLTMHLQQGYVTHKLPAHTLLHVPNLLEPCISLFVQLRKIYSTGILLQHSAWGNDLPCQAKWLPQTRLLDTKAHCLALQQHKLAAVPMARCNYSALGNYSGRQMLQPNQ